MSMLFLRRFMPAFCAAACVSLVSVAAEPVDIGSHRELFVDDHVIEKIEGDSNKRLPNLMLIGYLMRVLEERLLASDAPPSP